MEAVGLGIGSVSLLFQVFAGCIKGYQLLSEARGLEENHQYYRIRFKTEQCRLLDWASIVDLSEDDSTLSVTQATRQVILQVLDEQYRLLFRFGRVDDRLRPLARPFLFEETTAAGTHGDVHTQDEDEKVASLRLRFPDRRLLLKKSLKFIQSTTKYPARLRWALSDKSAIEDILGKLAGFNDYLCEILSNQQLQALSTQQTQTNYHILQLNDKLEDLREIVKAGFALSGGGTKPSETLDLVKPYNQNSASQSSAAYSSKLSIPAINSSNGSQLSNLAQVKALMSAIEYGKLTDNLRHELGIKDTQARMRPMRLSRSDIQFIQEGRPGALQRTSAWFKPSLEPWRRVWIEWKNVEPRQRHTKMWMPDSLVLGRFEALVQLLRESEYTAQFRALRCLGYFVRDLEANEIQPGLVFENPDGVDPSALPVTLHQILGSRTTPSLSARLKLIQTLVESLERLHAVNWLHKGLRSQNILFFCDAAGKVDYSKPFLSGFDYARPANADFMSEIPPCVVGEDLYRHPAVQGGPVDDAHGFGFKKHHDIYSLGIIVVEVSYWEPIDAIIGFDKSQIARSSETARVKEILLGEEFDEGIRGHVGDDIGDVVKACLAGPKTFPTSLPTELYELDPGLGQQEWLYDSVVRRLRPLRI